MQHENTYLQNLSNQINLLKEAYANAKDYTTTCKSNMQDAYYWIGFYKSDISDLKSLADEKFEMSRLSWDDGDRDSAFVYSEEGKEINQQIEETRESLNASYEDLDMAKEEFQQALSVQKELKTQLDQAIAQHKTLFKSTRQENISDWLEKPCKRCGAMIQYKKYWSHQPNYCHECKEQFNRHQN